LVIDPSETWRLLDKPDRTAAEDTLMIHCAHASRYHWETVGDASNRAIGEWQISRVYSVLGRAEPALHHARLCKQLTDANALPPFQQAWAHEAMARALSLSDKTAARAHHQAASELIESIKDPRDRNLVRADLQTIAI
jgi:hypothetical protein